MRLQVRARTVDAVTATRLRRALLGIGATVWALAVWAVPAGAQTTTTSETTTTSSTTVPTSSAVTLDNDQTVMLALIALAFGVVAIGFVLAFLYRDRVRSFSLLDTPSREGGTPTPVSEAALAEPSGAPEGKDVGEPTIQGPNAITVGQKTNFVVVGSGDASVTWGIEGEATISASSGKMTAVTAGSAGGLRLTATVGTSVLFRDLLAEKPATDSRAIPFLGIGWGTVVIALAVASVTASLGLTKVLDGQAVAGILGSLVTYSVTRGAANAGPARADSAE